MARTMHEISGTTPFGRSARLIRILHVTQIILFNDPSPPRMGDQGEEEQRTNAKGGYADESRVKRHKKSCNRVTAEAKAFAHNESRKPCLCA